MLVAALFGHDRVPGYMMRWAIDRAAVVVHHTDAFLRQNGDIAIRQKEDLASVFEKRGDIARDKIFAVTQPDYRRRTNTRRDDFVRIAGRQKNQGVDAAKLLERLANRVFERGAALRVFFDEMSDDFRVRLGDELVALTMELLLQLEIIFDDSIVDDDNLAGAVTVRVRILFRGAAVRGPAGVADAVGAFNGRFLNDFLEIAQLARGAADFELSVFCDNRDARGVVAAVLQLSQAFDDDRHHLLRPNVTDNSAHARDLLGIYLIRLARTCGVLAGSSRGCGERRQGTSGTQGSIRCRLQVVGDQLFIGIEVEGDARRRGLESVGVHMAHHGHQ